MNPLRLLIRMIFFPIQILTILVYPELLKNKILFTYCWYRNKKDYDEIVNSSIDDDNKNYEKWLADAELKLGGLDGEVEYIKIAIQPKKLKSWLDRKKLANNEKNRKNYAIEVYKSAKKYGVENQI